MADSERQIDAAVQALQALTEGSVDGGAVAAAVHTVEQALLGLPPEQAAPHQRLVQAALTRAGFTWQHAGGQPAVILVPQHREAWCNGKKIVSLNRSKLLWRLLHTLATEADRLDREALYERVWELPYRPPDSDNSLGVAINRLRKRMDGDAVQVETLADGRYRMTGVATILSWAQPDAEVSTGPAHNISAPVDPLLGRDAVVTDLQTMLSSGDRLITLQGPGGMGKTRAALALGWAETHSGWAGGVWWVDLMEASSSLDVIRQLAGVLETPLRGAETEDSALQTILEALARRGRTLLLLDNAEQLVDVGTVFTTLLEAAPELHMVLTSRRRMGLTGERSVALSPLDAEAAKALFLARAQGKVGADDGSDAEIAELVHALDGMPLAIEMAAARTGLMTPAEIHAQLDERLSLLRRADPDAEGQTQTMRDVVQWSWSLLSEDERSALIQLSVFRGGFSRMAAEAVVQLEQDRWAVMDALEALKDHSMIWSQEGTGESPRFRLPADVRAIALEHAAVDQMTAVALRHAEWFLSHSESLEPELHGPRSGEALASLALELDNGLIVARQAHIQDVALAARATLALSWVLTRTGPMSLLSELIQPMLAQTDALTPKIRARLLDLDAFIQTMQGRLKQAEAAARSALEAADDQEDDATRAQVLIRLASILLEQGATDESMTRFQEAETHGAQAGAAPLHARALYAQGFLLSRQGRFPEARAHFERALLVARGGDARVMEGLILASLGGILVRMRSLKTAEDCFKQTLEIFRAQGERRRETTVLVDLIILYTHQRRYEDGLKAAKDAVAVARAVGNQLSLGHVLLNRCELHRVFGHLDLALADGEEALIICDKKGSSSGAIAQSSLGMIRHEQGERQEALYHYSRALPVLQQTGDTLMSALIHGNVGLCLHEAGRLEEAETAYAEAIETLSETDNTWEEALICARRAALWAETGRATEAAALVARAGQILDDLGADNGRPAVALYAGFVDREGLKTWTEDYPGAADASDETRLALGLLAARLEWTPGC